MIGGKVVHSEPIMSYTFVSNDAPKGPWLMGKLGADFYWLNNGNGNLSKVYNIDDPRINELIQSNGIEKDRLVSIGVYDVTYELQYIPIPRTSQ